jgi:hypothetical protein
MTANEIIANRLDDLCANNLSNGLGNAKLCSTSSNGALIRMADPGNCLEKIKTHKDEGITQTVAIAPYFTRLISKPFDVYTCSKEYTRLLTLLSLATKAYALKRLYMRLYVLSNALS